MPTDLRSRSLIEISQELTRFKYELRGNFRCPTCLRDYRITSNEISEEHIIPAAAGGKITTFLCRKCNSTFGHNQTRWLTDWIELNESKLPFHEDPKKQRAQLEADGRKVNGILKIADDGAFEFYADRRRSNPEDYDAHWNGPKPKTIKITSQMPVFQNEQSLRVGFLTAAYGLWFKHFGYSFILQSSMDIVRKQIQNPNEDIMTWNYVIDPNKGIIDRPQLGVMRFGSECFPVAAIYDQVVLLPTPKSLHPPSTEPNAISFKQIAIAEQVADRYQHRNVGPAVLICDGQPIIEPDMIPTATIPPQYIWLDPWN